MDSAIQKVKDGWKEAIRELVKFCIWHQYITTIDMGKYLATKKVTIDMGISEWKNTFKGKNWSYVEVEIGQVGFQLGQLFGLKKFQIIFGFGSSWVWVFSDLGQLVFGSFWVRFFRVWHSGFPGLNPRVWVILGPNYWVLKSLQYNFGSFWVRFSSLSGLERFRWGLNGFGLLAIFLSNRVGSSSGLVGGFGRFWKGEETLF